VTENLPDTAAPKTLWMDRLFAALDEDRAAERMHHVIDALDEAFDRHRAVHDGRFSGCEMCDLRGVLAAHEMLNREASSE
jgi:hypothetical protein